MRIYVLTATTVFLLLMISIAGCDKEKIVESTEYIHDIEYVESPPDTVFHVDTTYISDSIVVHVTDTVRLTDTVVTTQNHYDTIFVTDTVFQTQYQASASAAVEAMQHYTDPFVLEYVNQMYGLGEGWIFYLASSQMDITHPSANIYDIYGYLEFYSADWSAYYPFEFYWRLTYTDGDPSVAGNWQMSEPPAKVSGHQTGIAPSSRNTPTPPIHH